jgi:hypothetical protein
MKQSTIVAFLLASAACGAQAAEIRPLIKAGADFGGDTMVRATFTNGDTQNIRGNEGFYLGGGAAIIDAARNMEYHLTAAYKFFFVDADNGDIEWTRVPLEALAFYRLERLRFGGGLTYHVNPRLEGSGVVGGLDLKFKNALGVVLQADWRATESLGLGVRYTFLEYEAKGNFTGTAKASGFGLAASFSF